MPGGFPLCAFVSSVVNVAEVFPLYSVSAVVMMVSPMRYMLKFLWNATRGHHLAPWRSPYLLWRMETYTGVKMQQIGFLEFWEFLWRERSQLWRFLKWTGEMERYAHSKPKSS